MKTRFFVLAALACWLPVSAQQPPAVPGTPAAPALPQDAPGLKVRGLSFQLESEPGDLFAHDAATTGKLPGVKLDVKGYLNHEHSVLPITGDSVVITTSPDPASVKDVSKVAAKANLPSQFKTGIFMFLPGTGRSGDAPFRLLVIDDSKRAFPPGSFQVFNLSALPVQMQLEKQAFDFKPGEAKVIDRPPVGANNSSGMTAYTLKDGKRQRIASNVWPHPGERRSLQVLFVNPQSGELRIREVRDIVIPRL